MTELSDLDKLLDEMEDDERLLSKRRARLHDRIDFLRANGNADGTCATPEQIEALDEQERELSRARKEIHAKIDGLRAQRERLT